MWMMIKKFLLAGMVVFWMTPAFGEYYQYKDQNGVLRFTDDLASVPPDQRPGVKTHQSVASSPSQQTSGAAAKGTQSRPEALPSNDTTPSTGGWQERNAQQRQQLDQMQAELKETYEALQAERSALKDKVPPKGSTMKEKVAYTEKVEALNAKIARYEDQLNEFNEKVNDYNAQVNK